jgi:hypothetical protein
MERGHQGLTQAIEKLQEIVAILPTEETELVLEADHVGPAVVEKIDSTPVVLLAVLPDLEGHLRPVVIRIPAIVQRDYGYPLTP